jgi:hypothetical protein
MSKPVEFHSVIEIYITNECNLTCRNCNRYNNYDFSGHFDWRDSEQAILAWGQRITAPLITIIGGEPAMHPELFDWVKLARRAWPEVPVMVQTNGTIHHPDTLRIRATIKNFGFVASLHHDAMTHTIAKKNTFLDTGEVMHTIDNTEFMECALVDHGSVFGVHDSDPELAFAACGMKYSHTILNGRLYKCPMVAVLPEFRKQYAIELTAEQEHLLDSYRALSHDCTDQELLDFLHNEHEKISQCRLCPDRHIVRKVDFDPKRKRRPKIIPIVTNV